MHGLATFDIDTTCKTYNIPQLVPFKYEIQKHESSSYYLLHPLHIAYLPEAFSQASSVVSCCVPALASIVAFVGVSLASRL